MDLHPEVNVLQYKFNIYEIAALYRMIILNGWIPRGDAGIDDVVNRVCQIAEQNELATRHSKTT